MKTEYLRDRLLDCKNAALDTLYEINKILDELNDEIDDNKRKAEKAGYHLDCHHCKKSNK